ncbi:MEKHLA domain-containing protein [Flavobacterium sp. JAS]|uniref:MEKHLA domain-containing protein n=1 Tax=Flavobacterium sp. JAS TaxID=2897329 RepID=UPI001E4AFA3A|nr:MEKHLA domain-containing protein [Flavobacterium sp. JAS]MCD0470527.1 MEKHLA domain-containing protein [Flavobacterium sp. JAS]
MELEKWYPLIKQIDDCFLALNGTNLPCPGDIKDRYKWLHEQANYSILGVDNSADSIFIYANQYALSCFKYTHEELLSLPSKLSASETNRAARAVLFEKVNQNGIVYNYSAPRVDKYGNSFTIHDAIIWKLEDKSGNVLGQAALFHSQKRESVS